MSRGSQSNDLRKAQSWTKSLFPFFRADWARKLIDIDSYTYICVGGCGINGKWHNILQVRKKSSQDVWIYAWERALVWSREKMIRFSKDFLTCWRAGTVAVKNGQAVVMRRCGLVQLHVWLWGREWEWKRVVVLAIREYFWRFQTGSSWSSFSKQKKTTPCEEDNCWMTTSWRKSEIFPQKKEICGGKMFGVVWYLFPVKGTEWRTRVWKSRLKYARVCVSSSFLSYGQPRRRTHKRPYIGGTSRY